MLRIDVEAGQGLSESNGENSEEREKDGRRAQHAKHDDLHDSKESMHVKDRDELGKEQWRCAREIFWQE